MPPTIVTAAQRDANKMRAEVKGCCLACGVEDFGDGTVGIRKHVAAYRPFRAYLWDTQPGAAGQCVSCVARDWTNEQAHDVMAAYQASRRQEED